MSNIELLEKTPLSLMEVKTTLDKVKKRDGEFGFRGNKTFEYVTQFIQLSKKDYESLRSKLIDLNVPRLKPEHIVKIMDTLPKFVSELDVILQGYPLTINKDNKAKIIGVIKEFLPKK